MRAMKKALVLHGEVWRWFNAHLNNNFWLMTCFGKKKKKKKKQLPREMGHDGIHGGNGRY